MNGPDDVTRIFRDLSSADLLQLAAIVVGALALIVLNQRVLPWVADKLPSRFRLRLMGLVSLLRLVILGVAIALIIPLLIEPTYANLVTLFGAAGLAIGFALKEFVSSLIAGVVALYETPYRLGDWIEIEGAYGEVKAINMRSLEIVTPDDTVVFVPHMKLWDQLLYNANDGGQTLMCVADFYLHPRHDAARAKRALHDVALTSAFLEIDKPIAVIVLEKPWGTHYRLKAYPVDARQQFHFLTDLTVRGKAALAEMGMEFAVAPAVAQA